MVTGSEDDVPEIATSGIVSDVIAMMVVVEGSPTHQRQNSHRTPRNLIACVVLVAKHAFVAYPEEVSKAVGTRPKDEHGQC